MAATTHSVQEALPRTIRFGRIASSNDMVIEMAGRGAPEHTVVVAQEQTDARGGSGRWHAPLGGLWMSSLWRPMVDACSAPLLTLAAGLGVCRAIRHHAGVDARLKWPNDVVVRGRKVAGVIVEGAVEGHDVIDAAVGVGINVNNPLGGLPAEIQDRTTTLSDAAGTPLDLRALERDVAKGLQSARSLVDHPVQLVGEFYKLWRDLGQGVIVDTGATTIKGIADRIDHDGALVVETTAGHHRLDDPTLAKFVRVV